MPDMRQSSHNQGYTLVDIFRGFYISRIRLFLFNDKLVEKILSSILNPVQLMATQTYSQSTLKNFY